MLQIVRQNLHNFFDHKSQVFMFGVSCIRNINIYYIHDFDDNPGKSK